MMVLLTLGEHRGVQNVLMSNKNQAAQLNPSVIPTPNDAFGCDPLELRPDFITERKDLFFQQNPIFDEIFHLAVN